MAPFENLGLALRQLKLRFDRLGLAVQQIALHSDLTAGNTPDELADYEVWANAEPDHGDVRLQYRRDRTETKRERKADHRREYLMGQT